MKLIEAEKVVQAIKDYWKAQVDNTPNDLGFEELSSRMDGYLKYNSDLLKTIDELPSIQPDTTTHDSIPVETGKKDDYGTSGDCINRQQAINKIKPWLEVKGYSWGELNMLRAVINELENMPSAQPETNCSEIPNSSDTISRQAAIDAIYEDADWLAAQGSDWQVERMERDKSILKSLPSAQPERKDALEKAVAVEVISDVLMSWFDISATYAYDVAESAVNRIEVMAKEMGKR